MSGTNPRRRRAGSIRGEATPEPLGLDPAADDAAASEPAAADLDPAAAEPFDETAPIGRAGTALVPMIDPHGEMTDVIRDVPEMSVEDVERRIGATGRGRARRRVAVTAPATTRVAANRRVTLWRDSATILIFVVVALLAARYLLPSDNSSATASPTPTESEIAIGSNPGQTGIQFSAAPTLGNIVPPSLHIDATPTPIPVITLPPATPKPTPGPSGSTKPGTTPKPSHTPAPSHTVPPPPIAGFTNPCPDSNHALANTPLTFTGTSSGVIDTYAWTFGDGGTDTSASGQHTYVASGNYTVTLTVTGPGGHDTASDLCYVDP